MRKFLVFFVLLFGVMCGAMAADAWPQNVQDDTVDSECYQIFWNDGSVELEIYFDTDVYVNPSCGPLDATEWLDILNQHKNDISSIVIYGSADRQRRDKIPDKNIELSIKRAQWIINNALQDPWKTHCTNSLGDTQTDKCQVYIMGDANDAAHSPDGGMRNSNASARSARIRVIWRNENCKQETIDNINGIKTKLEQIRPQHTDKTDKINEALDIIGQLNNICTQDGNSLYASESEKYSRLLSELGVILADLAKTIPSISVLFQQSNFSAMFSTADIDLYYSRIQGLMGNRSVWRNTEGRFNTARLASDSIAGVVLGTIGGIVTSKLVKKNQLKQGFEDLSCNVGGQRVADYGDTFSIGLQ